MPSKNGCEGVAEVCKECGKPTLRIVEMFGHKYPFRVMCECDEAKAEERRKEREAQAMERRRSEAFESAEMRKFTFDADDGKAEGASQVCKAYADRFADVAKDGYGLLLFGKPDQGKTFLSACIANRLIDGGCRVVMRSVPGIVANSGGFGDDIVEHLSRCDLLILDDLGAERDTSFSREVIYRVIEVRHSRKKPIIISTNLQMKDFANPGSIAVERIYNRILERCLPVPVESGRRRAKKETYAEIKAAIGIS